MLNIAKFKQERKNLRLTLPTVQHEWKPPKDFPNLSAAKILGVDTETYDPELLDAGPGWGRKCGHIVGVSLATEDEAWYFPVRHQLDQDMNISPDNLFPWLQDELGTYKPKVFANAAYDIGWLAEEGVTVRGKCYDVQAAEALLDNTKFTYSLESLAQQYFDEGKESNELYKWCARAYGGKADGKQRANIYRAPVPLVGVYAESDARLPLAIFQKQWKLLEQEGLLKIFDLETRILPMLIEMRQRGVRIDEEALLNARESLSQQIDELHHKLVRSAGFDLNVNSSNDLAVLCRKFDIPFEVTAKGNPSFQATWLERQPYEILHWVREIRKLKKTVSTFIDGLQSKNIDGRIYGQFNALRSGDAGTITGRFSSSSPNLQNIPSRDPVLGPLMRSIFVPDSYYPEWCKLDYSSIEFRCFAHRSQDPTLLAAYKDDPNTDFHAVVEKMVGGNLPRVAYKTFNFSRMYGGGINTLTNQMLKSFEGEERERLIKGMGFKPLTNTAEQLARILMNSYDANFPMVGDQLEKEMELAQMTGEVRTQLGRRIKLGEYKIPKNGDKYYGAYKALNYYNQGTAADIMKSGMVLAYEDGLFNEDRLGAPHMTIHDELSFSYHPDMREDIKEAMFIMEQAVQLTVPLVVDAELGPNWGAVTSKAWSDANAKG